MSDFLNHFSRLTVLVVGDVVLDEYVFGSAARMSREAPVPVLEFTGRRVIPGGAANPAANVAALGAHAAQVGVVGADAAGDELRAALQTLGIDVAGLLSDPARPTTVKQRIMAQMGLRFPQQLARIDRLSREPVSAAVTSALVDAAAAWTGRASAVLFSDYHNGMLTAPLVDAIRTRAAASGLLLTADAQGDFLKYADFGLVKCNADEAATFLRRALTSDADFAAAAVELRSTLRLTHAMVITRGPEGATVADAADRAERIPAAHVEDVFDTVGAGDTAIAVLTLAVAAGAPLSDAVRLANAASGIVVRRVGNYAPSLDELRREL
ncbi:MAG: D-glycero-beta-D-manno-heptose-7-phosphate kinase [Burkholderiales bacterium]|nr:D-glycero-beta-D-manno-heptose-7-phosphate kinase [Burkholderiales bacterium]